MVKKVAVVVIQSISELCNVFAAGVVQHSANWALAPLILNNNIDVYDTRFEHLHTYDCKC